MERKNTYLDGDGVPEIEYRVVGILSSQVPLTFGPKITSVHVTFEVNEYGVCSLVDVDEPTDYSDVRSAFDKKTVRYNLGQFSVYDDWKTTFEKPSVQITRTSPRKRKECISLVCVFVIAAILLDFRYHWMRLLCF